MPIYEYRCHRCGKRSSVFARSISSPVTAACSHCGSTEMSRLISRVAVLRSEDDVFEGMAGEASLGDVDENDPGSVARWVRRMSQQMGEPLEPEMEADLERMEAGELPDDDLEGGLDDGFGEE
ncbi:MAG: zinc ribbon domain-containing protein [Chloroflexi bacterium]|nr:zinc ribbon domain-containing protein [Chloroflexota bacterium]